MIRDRTVLGLIIVAFAATSSVAIAGPGPRPTARIGGGKIPKTCTFKGKKLWGKVQVVEHFPDFKVQVVEHFPDLKVKAVTSFPDACGKWQLVEHFPDFKVQYVEHFPDFKIQMVEHFPGLP
jgi:hypothetical protein